MKKQIFTLTFFLALCLNSVVFAQQPTAVATASDPSSTLKPDDGDWGFGIKAVGLKGLIWENDFNSAVFQVRKVGDGSVLRLDLDIDLTNDKTSYKDVIPTGDYYYEEDDFSQFFITLAPGYESHFPGTRRLDPYVGVALPIIFVGKSKTTEIDDYVYNDGTYSKNESEYTNPGGFGIGLDGFVGVNYFASSRVSIGIEYGLGFSLMSQKGNPTSKTTSKVKSTVGGTEVSTITEEKDNEVDNRSISFRNMGVAGLNFIFYLGR